MRDVLLILRGGAFTIGGGHISDARADARINSEHRSVSAKASATPLPTVSPSPSSTVGGVCRRAHIMANADDSVGLSEHFSVSEYGTVRKQLDRAIAVAYLNVAGVPRAHAALERIQSEQLELQRSWGMARGSQAPTGTHLPFREAE